MIIRPFRIEDLEAVRSLHEQTSDFPFPEIEHPLYSIKDVMCLEDGSIIGAGLLRMTSEAILILDHTRSRAMRCEAIKELIQTGIFQCQKLGVDELHAFLTGRGSGSFAQVLENKFGFERCKGIPYTLRF